MRQSIHVPDKVYHVDKHSVKVYSLVDGHSTSLASSNTSGKNLQVMRLMHSMKQGIVITFLQSNDSPGKYLLSIDSPGNCVLPLILGSLARVPAHMPQMFDWES